MEAYWKETAYNTGKIIRTLPEDYHLAMLGIEREWLNLESKALSASYNINNNCTHLSFARNVRPGTIPRYSLQSPSPLIGFYISRAQWYEQQDIWAVSRGKGDYDTVYCLRILVSRLYLLLHYPKLCTNMLKHSIEISFNGVADTLFEGDFIFLAPITGHCSYL